MLAPIRRLPVEILSAIFIFYSSCHNDSPLGLLWVCRLWRGIALTMPYIWSNVCLRTWTNVEKVAFILDKTAVSPLYVEIDTDGDIFTSSTHKSPRYAGLVLAAMQAERWRCITIISAPSQYDVETDEYLKMLPLQFSRPLEGIQSFKIKSTRHDTAILLFCNITFPHGQVTYLELSLLSALYHFAQPKFTTIFHALITFKVEVFFMRTVVDILPQFQQLETLDAHGLCLPTYPVETDLQLVRTLKYMKIDNVSVQWMAGRTFPNLKECEIIYPLHPEMIVLGCSVNLPICTKFTYEDNTTDILPNFCIPILDILTIQSNVSHMDIGSRQLTAVWGGEAALLKPRILHLRTQCHEQHLIEALSMLPELEGLHLCIHPDGLGQMFFTSLQAQEQKEWNTQAVTHMCRLCPNLKSLSIWSPSDMHDEVTPLLHQLVESRQKTDMPLQSAEFWHVKERVRDISLYASPLMSDPWLSLCED